MYNYERNILINQKKSVKILLFYFSTDLGNDGGMSSDCSDDEGSPGGGGGHMPVVYPWMKKIHVSGAGDSCE